MSVGDKVRGLRDALRDLPAHETCVSFYGKPLYNLGMAFFPASLGLYDPDRESISTIVLGSDWGNADEFATYLGRKTPRDHKSNATVTWTDRMLLEAGFDLNDCFYSNAWPVMRAGSAKEQGHHSMRDDLHFVVGCQQYLRHTIKILKPRLVIALGNPCAWFLIPFFGIDWKVSQIKRCADVKIEHLNEEPVTRQNGVVFATATHPSHLNANRSKRRLVAEYGDETGLLIYARKLAGIVDASK